MNIQFRHLLAAFLCLLVSPAEIYPDFRTTPDSPVHINSEGKLVYKSDGKGDRVPDYSFCGYRASEEPIPDVPVKVIVRAVDGDATGRIQSAIDYISSLPEDENGFRGTVLLGKETFEIAGSLMIKASGVVLRGSGCKDDGTILMGTGVDRETLIRIAGIANRLIEQPIQLEEKYFPVNSTELSFSKAHPFKVGDRVIVNRPSTKEWIEKIGTDKIGIYVDYQLTHWIPGDFDINWDRTVVAVTANSITLDVPLTNSLDPQYGGGNVAKYLWKGRIRNAGVENLRCISSWDKSNNKDENHRWIAITMENVIDSWVRRVEALNFVSSAVAAWESTSRITVEDCKSLQPVGENGNFRRYSFHTIGQQILFQRCYSEYGYHPFSVGFTTPGPNAFVQCYAYMPFNFSGTAGGWATGVLFDKVTVDGGSMSFAFRDVDGQGGGWSAANSFCWQCRAAKIFLQAPPGAQNWAYASWAQGYGNGHHELQHTFVRPESFYYAQLAARTGKESEETQKILIYDRSETVTPTPELTPKLSQRSKTPDLIMDQWIDMLIAKYPINNDVSGAKNLDDLRLPAAPVVSRTTVPCSLINGWIVMNNKVLTGRRNRTSLWRGSTRPSELKNPRPNLLKFVPGRIGRGLTDDLDTLTSDMIRNDEIVMQNFPALWYERRRDDHARTRRADADVWAPFYEQPFSRSGQGEAFDRLSKYDLSKWNTWYWMRLKKFADLADEKGLIFLQEHYLQHNIIEEGAHWADYPWRSANNINNTGFAENPHYVGDKRIFMAGEFYDTTHPVRNHLHREYIRKSLDNYKGNTNVIHHLGMEFTGPLHFIRFWLDVISQWEKENNMKVLVMLAGTKDVQDAILADPARSKAVDIIDICQWHYRADGSLYAPPGGVSLAPRQYARIMDVGETSFQQVYHAVREYRQKFPDKAVIYSSRRIPLSEWAVFIAGGSLASLPPVNSDKFFRDAAEMKVQNLANPVLKQYILGKKGTGYIVFSESPEAEIDLKGDGNSYILSWIDPSSGTVVPSKIRISGDKARKVKAPFEGAAVLWLHK